MEYILLFLLFLFTLSLRSRLARLEKMLAGATIRTRQTDSVTESAKAHTELPVGVTPLPASPTTTDLMTPQAAAISSRPLPPREPNAFDRFVDWLQEDWLVKLGGLLLILAFAWFASLAISNGWIGPMGQITIGIVAGAALLVFGWLRMQKYVQQGSIFLVVGSTAIILTVFGARFVYNIFDPFLALGIMFLASAFVGIASVQYKSRSLSLISLVLAVIVPFLTNSGSSDFVSLFAYLFVVILGAIWIVLLTGQRTLTVFALIAVALYSFIAIAFGHNQELLPFAYAFAVLFFATNTAGILKSSDRESVPDLLTAVLNGLLLLAWIMTYVRDEWQSLTIAAWTVVFLGGAFAVFRLTSRPAPFYIYSGIAVVFLGVATALELEGAYLAIAYTLEAAMISLVGYLLTRDRAVMERLASFFLVPLIMSIPSMTAPVWKTAVVHEHFFVLALFGLATGGIGLFLRELGAGAPRGSAEAGASEILLVGSSIYFYLILWLSLHAVLPEDTAVLVSLLVYTLVGLVAYIRGIRRELGGLRAYGAALLGFVVLRLLFVDVWNMRLETRLLTFAAIGGLLMSTAFIKKKS